MMKYLRREEKETLDSSTPLNDSIETVFFFGKHDWNFIPFKSVPSEMTGRCLWMSFCDSVSTRWNDTTSKHVSSSFKSFFPSKQSNKKQPNTWKWVIRFKSNDFSSWLVLHFSLTVSLSLSLLLGEERKERDDKRRKGLLKRSWVGGSQNKEEKDKMRERQRFSLA